MKDFKIGDRVRVKDKSHVESSPLLNYAYLMVIDINDDNVTLGMPGTNLHLIVETEFLELYKSPDPKTAFLTELSDLLRKYDAKIHVWAGDDGDKVLIFELKDNIDICYPNEWLNDYKFEFPITPDNIFNYDKE